MWEDMKGYENQVDQGGQRGSAYWEDDIWLKVWKRWGNWVCGCLSDKGSRQRQKLV